MPTAAFPGIGASIRTPDAARFMAISSARFVILLIFTPAAGCNSYRVTAGPRLISKILVWTPKLFNVSTNNWPFTCNSSVTLRVSSSLLTSSIETGGNWYVFFFSASFCCSTVAGTSAVAFSTAFAANAAASAAVSECSGADTGTSSTSSLTRVGSCCFGSSRGISMVDGTFVRVIGTVCSGWSTRTTGGCADSDGSISTSKKSNLCCSLCSCPTVSSVFPPKLNTFSSFFNFSLFSFLAGFGWYFI